MGRGSRQLSQAEILAAFVALGFAAQYIDQRLGSAKNFVEFKQRFEELQEEAKKAWRKRAFELHPDRGGNEDEFKRVKESYDLVVGMQVGPRPRPRPPMPRPGRVVVFHMNFGGGYGYGRPSGGHSSTTGGTNSTTGGWF